MLLLLKHFAGKDVRGSLACYQCRAADIRSDVQHTNAWLDVSEDVELHRLFSAPLFLRDRVVLSVDGCEVSASHAL